MFNNRFVPSVLGLLLVACAAPLEDPDRFEQSGTCEDTEIVLQRRCGGRGCHSASDPASDLDLESEEVFSRLIDQPGSEGCDQQLLVDSQNISSSLLLDKLSGNPICGEAMPLGSKLLTQVEVACIEEYLQEKISADSTPSP